VGFERKRRAGARSLLFWLTKVVREEQQLTASGLQVLTQRRRPHICCAQSPRANILAIAECMYETAPSHLGSAGPDRCDTLELVTRGSEV